MVEEKYLQEEEIKAVINEKLQHDGWETKVAWGHTRGIDIEATKNEERWVIEVKGPGSRPEMRNNYFISMLGEMLQRMDDERTRYSIALPKMEKYIRLWQELPTLAKKRTTIDLLLVDENGNIEIHQ